MLIIKYMILIFLFISSAFVGEIMANQYKYRLLELEELKTSLNILKSKIKFTYEPIPEVFKEISEKTSANISKLFEMSYKNIGNYTASESWEMSIDNSQNYLKEEDKQVIKTLSKLLRGNRY